MDLESEPKTQNERGCGSGLNVCVLQNAHVDIRVPQVMVLGGGDFGRSYGRQASQLPHEWDPFPGTETPEHSLNPPTI